MSRLGAGILTTRLNTVAGQTYILSFYLAGNPKNVQGIKTLQVQVGSLNQQFTFDSTGHRTHGDRLSMECR